MMVSLEEAHLIYQARGKAVRKEKGYPPVLNAPCKPTHCTEEQIRDAITIVKLKEEQIVNQPNLRPTKPTKGD